MYQNAPPPHYNQGGYGAPSPPPQNPYGGGGAGGYYDNNMPQQQQGYNPGYGAPSPVNEAYQRANAAMARGPSPSLSNTAPNGGGGGAPGGGSASGLIRLTLRKPMGIVFEPMTDPHNPSQQRGVRICDLPRTGAAAMSQKLEVGDELLSINDKTMSRLTFDEIMDFIIEADKERVDLLFRRPGKNKEKNKAPNSNAPPGGQGGPPLSPMGLGGIGSNSNSVKWIDEKSDMGGKLTEDVREPERDNGRGGGRSSGRGGNSKVRDDPSVDDTYNDGYTVESQSQYTMETYEDDRGGRGSGGANRGSGRGRYEDDVSKEEKHGRSRGGRNDHHRDHHSSKRKSSVANDPVESSGFLDLLIDTLCTSVMGRDARDMCGDRSEPEKVPERKSKYDEDDEFTVDDGTYATYEENEQNGRSRNHRRMEDEESLATEDEQTFVTNEDDGTRTLESKDILNAKNSHQMKDDKAKDMMKKSSTSKSKSNDHLDDLPEEMDDDLDPHQDPMAQFRSDPPPHGVQSFQQTAPDPPTKTGSQIHASATAPAAYKQQAQQQHQRHMDDPIVVDHQMNEQESAIASGIALPVKELEYDAHDYGADVSVMESLGGPSLLVERARHENAVNTGADRASFENLDRQDPELADLVARQGDGFVPDPGMTREETAFRDPYKFYEFAVCALLRENEPEKVRLLSKLMAKYRGRERHLINKLSARYDKEAGGNQQDGNDGGHPGDQVASAPSVEKAKSAENSINNAAASKAPMSVGMDRIYEGEDGEEVTEGSSSVLNDPSRANMAAIESAKKKMESSNNSNPNDDIVKAATSRDPSLPNKKSSNDDGWPPAMSDPWGANGPASGASGGAAQLTIDNVENAPSPIHHHHDDHDDHSGSYSDGSSYTEDDDEVDGTSPAIIAQVSELLNYVYGKTSVAGQIDRVSTIMRAYEGREAVLLELLETKALIKANADSNRGDGAELPVSLRNSPGLNNNGAGKAQGAGAGGEAANNDSSNESSKKLTPQTPVSVLTAPTMVEYPGPVSPATVASPKGAISPSAGTLNTVNTTASKKKKKGIFGGFFGGKKKDKRGNFPGDQGSAAAATGKAAGSPGKNKGKKAGKKGQMLGSEDDRSI